MKNPMLPLCLQQQDIFTQCNALHNDLIAARHSEPPMLDS